MNTGRSGRGRIGRHGDPAFPWQGLAGARVLLVTKQQLVPHPTGKPHGGVT